MSADDPYVLNQWGIKSMVLVLKGSQRSNYPDYFDQLFRLRHQIFFTGRGWSLPSCNGREIDQYDIDEAVYFLDVNDDGKIEGTVRITPTVRASLTADRRGRPTFTRRHGISSCRLPRAGRPIAKPRHGCSSFSLNGA